MPFTGSIPMNKIVSRFGSFLLAFGLAAAAFQTPVQAQSAPQTNLPRTSITAGMYLIDAQVAMTPREREVGLMFRKEMPAQEGMLFVFDQPATQCFWMRNTILPLSTAFVADDGTIVNVADMQPMTETSHCSEKPVRYVLEMNQGWFEKRGIKAGQRLSGRPFAAHK